MKCISYLYVIAAAVLWGLIGLFLKQLYAVGFTAIQVVVLRSVFASAALALYMLVRDRKDFRVRLRDCWCFVGTGIISLVLFNLCYFTAIRLTDLSMAAVLLYTSPVFVMIFSIMLFGERLTLSKMTALLVTICGCVCVTGMLENGISGTSTFGILAGVGSGLFYALYSIFSRYALNLGYSASTISLYTFIFASAGSIPFSGIWNAMDLLPRTDTLLYSCGIGILCCVFPYILYTTGMSRIDTSKAAILATAEPMVATVISVAVFSEPMTVIKLLGCVLILSSVAILNMDGKRNAGIAD